VGRAPKSPNSLPVPPGSTDVMMADPNPFSEIRLPAVAGRFYPSDAAALDREVGSLLGSTRDSVAARMVVVPHAGYVYSGAIAGETYARAEPRRRTIVICPNHTGLGSAGSVSSATAWRLPGGELRTDIALRDLVEEHAGLDREPLAHLREHAVEVQLPFLRRVSPDAPFVAICLARLSLAECKRVAKGIVDAVHAAGAVDDVLIVASTDMSHYVPAEVASREDAFALDCVNALDAEGLFRVVEERRISMCGYIPTTVALLAARALGARRTELVRYGNSGETSGDLTSVVGYAGVLVI
jgi:AmmeMemoRadiSam system protein B